MHNFLGESAEERNAMPLAIVCRFRKCVCMRFEAWFLFSATFDIIVVVVVNFFRSFVSHLFFRWSLSTFSLIWPIDIRPVWPDSNRTFISFPLYARIYLYACLLFALSLILTLLVFVTTHIKIWDCVLDSFFLAFCVYIVPESAFWCTDVFLSTLDF